VRIKKTAIVGMGALGLMYGEHIRNRQGKESVCFVMDSERYYKNKNKVFTVNGKSQDFLLADSASATPADLVIVATKYNDLESALDTMQNLIGDRTVIMSVLNGISSEEVIAARYGELNLVHSVAIGMDAVREENELYFSKMGRLQIGAMHENQLPALKAVQEFFDLIEMPYSVEKDIRHALWAKFLLNVGINQTCMVFDTTYGGALKNEEFFQTMKKAMFEVIAVAQKEGINLTEQDYDSYIKILHTLNPDGYPSMRQDALTRRASEVDLFAGTVLKIAAKHNLSVPVNEFYYNRIKEIEAGYQ
jgi:2-dehydropantoate 2-reductase